MKKEKEWNRSKWLDFVDSLKCDIGFLKRKDVSWRFKILNILSGDRLRFACALSYMRSHEVQNKYEEVKKYIKDWDNPTETDLIFLKQYYDSLDTSIILSKVDADDVFRI